MTNSELRAIKWINEVRANATASFKERRTTDA